LKIRQFLTLLAAVSVLAGCDTIQEFTQERYSRNNDLGKAWLSDQILPPEIDVSGDWKSDNWGDTFFAQNGQKIRGHLGDYPVEGVVSGSKAYLLVSQDGWYSYSAIVEMPAPHILIGYYCRGVPYLTSKRVDLRLDRK
jgi:hypothetical protein